MHDPVTQKDYNRANIACSDRRRGVTNSSEEFCITCAWRETCRKQFSMKAGQKCPEYCRDLTLRQVQGPDEDDERSMNNPA